MNNKKKSFSGSESFYGEGGSTGILLVHGLGGSPLTLRFLAQGLVRQGYTVSCPFIPGLAGGSDIDGLSSWQDWYEAVEKEFLALSEKCDRVIVGGLSTGAVLALRLAQDHGDKIEALSLYAPTLWPNGWGIPRYFHLMGLIRQKWFANFFMMSKGLPTGIKDERILKFWMDSVTSNNASLSDAIGVRGGKLLELRWLVRQVRKKFSQVTHKTLVMHPREDDMSDIKNSFEIIRGIKGPAELVALNDSYHMVTLDHQREQVVNRTIEFVEQILAERQIADQLKKRKSEKKQNKPSPALVSSSGAAE